MTPEPDKNKARAWARVSDAADHRAEWFRSAEKQLQAIPNRWPAQRAKIARALKALMFTDREDLPIPFVAVTNEDGISIRWDHNSRTLTLYILDSTIHITTEDENGNFFSSQQNGTAQTDTWRRFLDWVKPPIRPKETAYDTLHAYYGETD